MPEYLAYRDNLETPAPDESETFAKIVQVMTDGQNITRQRYGTAVRISHAKAHGLLKGKLRVLDNLPPEPALGLFARPDTYPVVVRMATAPGELLDDSKVSTDRGMSLKVFDVAEE
ncbi:MAG: hypothetical protein INR65_12015, partial [Gluconacetobacter diazotrophicus]|nr:hypothetical protein [Gluconacetobacter diazotrophicus]